MKRIGITQRRDPVPGRTEVRDALDVSLAEIVWSIGAVPIPLCSGISEVDRYLDRIGVDGFLLSGGNDVGSMPERDRLESAILKRSAQANVPVLGICRGMQMMNVHQGGHLDKVSGHVGSRHLLEGPLAPDTDVNSYHGYAVTQLGLGKDLIVAATAADGVIEAVTHGNLPWIGIMWHPERELYLSAHDKKIMTQLFSL